MRRAVLLLAVVLLLLGCPPRSEDKASASCTRIGDTCTYAPGKLGTCVAKDGCTAEGAACLVCQSQH